MGSPRDATKRSASVSVTFNIYQPPTSASECDLATWHGAIAGPSARACPSIRRPQRRVIVAVWAGLRARWLVAPTFDLADEILAAFRQLSGQNMMEARQALEQALAEP